MSNNIEEDIKIVEKRVEKRVETLNRHISNYEKSECRTSVYQELVKDRDAILNVLKGYKKNRNIIDEIRSKIKERQFELQQEYKDFKDDIRLNILQEIYYMFEGKNKNENTNT